MERFFDIIFSGLALLAFFPLLVIIILILKFSGEGEVFFFQERIGKDGKLFKLYKFVVLVVLVYIWITVFKNFNHNVIHKKLLEK